MYQVAERIRNLERMFDVRQGLTIGIPNRVKLVELGLEDVAAEVLDQRPDP